VHPPTGIEEYPALADVIGEDHQDDLRGRREERKVGDERSSQSTMGASDLVRGCQSG